MVKNVSGNVRVVYTAMTKRVVARASGSVMDRVAGQVMGEIFDQVWDRHFDVVYDFLDEGAG